MVRENDAYLLDTDTVSNYLDRRRGNEQLRQRIDQVLRDAGIAGERAALVHRPLSARTSYRAVRELTTSG